MQGRLSPPSGGRFQSFPRERWVDEFPLAATAGLDSIEWIYDRYGADVNPLTTDAGIARMAALSQQHGIAVRSVCADWFMDFPLVRASASEREFRLAALTSLLDRCGIARIQRMVIPFVDISKIETERDGDNVADALAIIWPAAERNEVEIHLETSLPPKRFRDLLARCDHPLLRVNYDSGNSASLGYDTREEFAAYGEWIGSVHVKDRVMGGGTVPLGQGDADLDALFDCMQSTGYDGDIILQVAREQEGDEVELAIRNREFVEQMVARYSI